MERNRSRHGWKIWWAWKYGISQSSFENKIRWVESVSELCFLMACTPGQGMMSWIDQKEQHGRQRNWNLEEVEMFV